MGFSLKKASLLHCIWSKYTTNMMSRRGFGASVLEECRVLELGQMIAGPFAGTILSYHGAHVIKIEPVNSQGDPLRQFRLIDANDGEMRGGTSYWWHSISRGKQSVCIDLNQERGQTIIQNLSKHCQVLIENFRPGRMEDWKLGPEHLHLINPNLIYCRVSGYGQTGPLRERGGFASVCEAFAGLRYLNGFPEQIPVRTNLSLGDTIASLHAVIGILLALLRREKLLNCILPITMGNPAGQVVDVALYESVFNLLEAVLPEFDGAGVIRGPSGTSVTGIVPTNCYPCRDGRYIVIGGNGDSIYQRLMRAVNRPDLAADALLSKSNAKRVERQVDIDEAISQWTRSHNFEHVQQTMDAASVPCGPINSIKDIAENPQFIARNMIETIDTGSRKLKIPAIPPLLSESPGKTRGRGPKLGEHTRPILKTMLGMKDDELDELESDGVIQSDASTII